MHGGGGMLATMTRTERPPLPTYFVGEPMRCPSCGGRGWHVGRQNATCSNGECAMTLAIAGSAANE